MPTVKLTKKDIEKLNATEWTDTHMQIWLEATEYQKGVAAEAIGISRPSMRAYLNGSSPVPRTVILACKAVLMMLQARKRKAATVNYG